MMLGYLLARAGVEVTVLEKHADFFCDFRGDTIHRATADPPHRPNKPPIQLMRLISHMPPVKCLLGRIVGLGFRREHIRSPHHANQQ